VPNILDFSSVQAEFNNQLSLSPENLLASFVTDQ